MRKKILLGFMLLLLSTGSAFADFKYTEETKSGMEMQMPGFFQSMMQNAMQNSSVIKTVYVKGQRKRIDYSKDYTSAILMCDKRQIVMLNHAKKIYNIKSLDKEIAEMKGFCGEISSVANQASAAYKTAQAQQPKNRNPLVIKTIITDTGLNETINGILTRKYIQELIISGNPTCIPDMHTKEFIWSAKIRSEDIQCPVIAQFKGCKGIPKPKMPDCFKNVKYVNQGLTQVPGFVVKSEITMDMSAMMKNNPDMQQDYQQDEEDAGGFNPFFGNSRQGNPNQGSGMGGKISTVTVKSNISSAPLPLSLFEIPAGYKLNQRYENDANFDF